MTTVHPDPDTAPCVEFPWCDGHDPVSPALDGVHHTSRVVDQFDGGEERRVHVSLYLTTSEFDEPDHVVVSVDMPSDWPIRAENLDEEIDLEIATLQRARAAANEIIAGFRGADAEAARPDDLAAAAARLAELGEPVSIADIAAEVVRAARPITDSTWSVPSWVALTRWDHQGRSAVHYSTDRDDAPVWVERVDSLDRDGRQEFGSPEVGIVFGDEDVILTGADAETIKDVARRLLKVAQLRRTVEASA